MIESCYMCRYCLSTMDVTSNDAKDGGVTTKQHSRLSRKELKTKIQQCKDWGQLAELFGISVETTRAMSLKELFPNIHPLVIPAD